MQQRIALFDSDGPTGLFGKEVDIDCIGLDPAELIEGDAIRLVRTGRATRQASCSSSTQVRTSNSSELMASQRRPLFEDTLWSKSRPLGSARLHRARTATRCRLIRTSSHADTGRAVADAAGVLLGQAPGKRHRLARQYRPRSLAGTSAWLLRDKVTRASAKLIANDVEL